MSTAEASPYQPTRTPSPQPAADNTYVPNGRPTSQILSNRQSLGLPQQHPNTVGSISTARFSTGGMFGTSQPGTTSGASLTSSSGNGSAQAQQQNGGTFSTSSSNEHLSQSSTQQRSLNNVNRHVSLAAGLGGGSNSLSAGQQAGNGTGNGNVGDRLANARAVSPRLPGSAGPGSNQFPSYPIGGSNGLLAGANGQPGIGGLGLGAAPGGRAGAGIRPASEYLGGGAKGSRGKEASPENEAIENWFTDLQAYEAQLDALASASMDQNFTDELQAIESWFRVLTENERTAALYSLLQQSTTAQVRFFQKVLSQMSQSDPVSALLSPAMGGSMQNQQDVSRLGATPNMGGLRSPGLNSGSGGFPSSPQVNQFLAPDAAVSAESFGSPSAQLAAQRNRMKQNRISAPGTLQVSEAGRFLGGQLNDVIERGSSPGGESNASRSPAMGGNLGVGSDVRPRSTDFAGLANVPPASRSPRPNVGGSGVVGLGLPNTGLKSPRFEDQFSPMLQGNWASLMNTPMMPMFGEGNAAGQNMSQADLAAALSNFGIGGLGAQHGGNVVLDDAAKFKRRPQNAIVYNDDGEPIPQQQQQTRLESPRPGTGFGQASDWRSPMAQQGEFAGSNSSGLQGLAGLGLAGGMGGIGLDAGNLAGLGMGMGMGIGMGMANISPNPMLNSSGFAGAQGNWSSVQRQRSQTERPRKSPMLRQGEKPGAGGGAGAGAGVAGENDVDERVLKDVAYWLRVLRLHKYTPNFQGEKWQDIVGMNDAKLQDKGVAALGARRKLLKVFANVRTHYKIPHPEGYLEELGTDDKDKDGNGDDQADGDKD